MDNIIEVENYKAAVKIKEELDRKHIKLDDLDLDSIPLEVLDEVEKLYVKELKDLRIEMSTHLQDIKRLEEDLREMYLTFVRLK